MAKLFDEVFCTVATAPGAGTIQLGPAVAGYRDFIVAGVPDGTTVSYSLRDGVAWEVGRGIFTLSTNSLSRGPLWSSSGGPAINATAAAVIGIAVLSEDILQVISLSGNTSGASSLAASSAMQFVGGANITLSGVGQTLSIIGDAGTATGGGSSSVYAIGNTAGSTTSLSTASSLSFSGGGIVSVGMSDGAVIISATAVPGGTSSITAASGVAASQVGNSITLYGSDNVFAVGNTTGSTTSAVESGTWALSGAGGVSVGLSNSIIIISGATAGGGGGGPISDYAVGNTTGSTTSQTASSQSFSGGGIVSVGFSNNSIIISATTSQSTAPLSGTAENLAALGNTTALSSSSVLTLTALSVSAAGGLSAGLSTTAPGQGVLVLSGATTAAQTNPTLSVYAVGNTTTSTSSGIIQAGSLSFDGAGLVSVGISGSSVVISATSGTTSQSVQTLGGFATGNTTGLSSRTTFDARSVTVSGSGAISVGYSSNNILIVAGPDVSSLNGASGISLSTVGNTISILNTLNLYATGNTAGLTSSEAETVGSLTFSGAGGAAVGFSNGTIIVSGATGSAAAGTSSYFAIGNTTGATSSESAVSALTVSGAGIASVGFSTTGAGASVLIVSASSSQSVQTLGGFAAGNTTGLSSSTTFDARSVTLSGAGIASVGYSSNNIAIISVPAGAASATAQSEYVIGNTTISSSTTQSLTSISVSGAGIVSVGFSTTAAGAGALVISVTQPDVSSLSGVSGISLSTAGSTISILNTLNLYASGNTTALTSSEAETVGSLTLSGAGGASIGFSNGTIVISGATAAAATSSFFAAGNTTGDTTSESTVSALTISGAGIASVGFASSSLIISASSSQSVQTLAGFATGNTTGSSSSTSFDARSVTVSGGGIVSVGYSSNNILIVSATSTPPAASQGSLSWSAVGNTTGLTSSSSSQLPEGLALSGAGGVSVGFSNSTIVISGATTTPQTVQTIGGFAVGNTTGSSSSTTFDARSVTLSGAGIASVGYSSNNIAIISVPSPAASGVVQNEFAIGNTTAATSSTTQTLSSISISGAGGVSVGFSTTAAGAGALVISGATTVASGTADSIRASGNTFGQSSSAVATLGSLTVSATGGISAGFSTAANSGVLMLSVAPPVASGTANSVAALGNTTSASSSAVATLASLSVSGAGGVSVGFATAANSGVLIISGATTVASGVVQNEFVIGNTTAATSSTTQTLSSISVSGAGIVSVGFSTTAAGAGALVISASSLQSVQTVGGFAVGNTTGSSSSTTFDARSVTVSGAGIASVGYSSNNILIVSVPPAGASGTANSEVALGNTTGATSSTVQTLGSLSVSGAGIVSVGFSTTAAGAGALVISASSAASGVIQNEFAIGNTTAAVSSTTQTLSSISISGAGGVSVGFSTTAAGAGALVISGATTTPQTVQTIGGFATGNTTGSSSSTTFDARSVTVSGAGLVSAGYSSNNILIVSGPVSAGQSATGNTTVSSSVSDFPFATPLGVRQISGSGIVSVGYSTATSSTGAGTTSSTTYTIVSAPLSAGAFAVGNTTGQTSSVSSYPFPPSVLSSNEISGAGIVSVGFSTASTSTGAGTTSTISYQIISATTSQSVQTIGGFAAGNTTGSSSSTTFDARSVTVSGAGIASVGYSSNNILIVSVPSPAASGAVQNEFAIGNTTAATSSTTQTLTSMSVSGAGIVSVGFSTTAAGAGALVISASSAASQGSLSLFAVGNTTVSSSTSSALPEAISVSGSGIVTVGYSSNTLIIGASSAIDGAAQNQFVIGNTTNASSTTQTLTSISVSGAGGVTVGFSTTAAGAGALVISGATTVASGVVQNQFVTGNTTAATSSTTQTLSSISISGAGGVSVGFSTTAAGAGALVISGATTVASGTAESRFASGNTFGQSSSAVGTLGSLTVSATGGISAGFSTAANSGILMLSVAPPVASGTANSIAALGNTTSASSSAVATLGSISVSGAGGVSVGFATAANSGVLIISGATTAASGALSYFASGNTTAATSSATNAGSLTLSGAGIVSVGLSTTAAGASAFVISASTAASGVVQNQFVTGNTTAATSSTTQTLSSISISGAGGVSVGFSTTAAGAGALVISGATTVASGVVQNQFAIGNTTAASSSTTQTLSSVSISGAGIVSVGYSTTAAGAGAIVVSASSATSAGVSAAGNTTGQSSSSSVNLTGQTFVGSGIASVGLSAGSILISASSLQSVQTIAGFAIGSTTGSSSSTTFDARSVTVSGAGAVSVGYSSNNILIISGATVAAGAQSLFAVGNTTSSVSSGVAGAGSLSFDAVGALSVGISNSSIVLSTPPVSTLSGVSGISLSTAGNTISIYEAPNSFIEPSPWSNSTTIAFVVGTMAVAPLVIEDPLVLNAVRFLASRNFTAGTCAVSVTAAGSSTMTASASWGSTQTLAIYSQQTGTSYNSFSTYSSTTAQWNMTASYSLSKTGASNTMSNTYTMSYPVGSVYSSSSFSTSTSTLTTTSYAQVNASSSNFTNWLRHDIPLAATLPPGNYLVGIMGALASGTATGVSSLAVTAPSWTGSTMAMSQAAALTFNVPGVVSAAGTAVFPGVGSTSSAGSVLPATIAWQSISSGVRLYFQAGML